MTDPAADDHEGPRGPQGPPGPARMSGFDKVVAFLIFASVAISCTGTFLALNNRATLDDLNSEGAERRDQNCKILETQHAETVRSLKLTYQYIAGLSPDEWKVSFNRLIITQLPKAERDARIDQAPPYCDLPGAKAEAAGEAPVGLPEPDPKIPKRPPLVDKAYKTVTGT